MQHLRTLFSLGLDMRAPQHTRQAIVRSFLNSILPLLQVVSACIMAWKALSLWTDTPFPIMVVITESMAPTFQPGDVLLISNHHNHVKAGDLPVLWFADNPFPMVHRVLQVMHQDHEDLDLT